MMLSAAKCCLFVVLLLSAQVANGFEDKYPGIPESLSVTATDSDFDRHFMTFGITFNPFDNSGGSTDIANDTCGFDVRLGLTANDFTGPLLEQIRFGSAQVPATAITRTYTAANTRLFSGSTAPSITVTVADSNGDGNDEVTVTESDGPWISDAGASSGYHILVFSVNCETPAAINPVPASVSITDVWYPYYTPLIEVSSEHRNLFEFTDESTVTDTYTGTLTIWTDKTVEDEYEITGYVFHTDTFCDVADDVSGCATTVHTTPPTFTNAGDGVWTIALSDVTPTTGNQVFIASVNADGYGQERSIRLVDLRPAPAATTDLFAATAPLIVQYTPEKAIDGTPETLALNFGDQVKFAVVMDLSSHASSATITRVWQINQGSGWKSISTADNSQEYGDITVQERHAGTYRLSVHVMDSVVATPYTTTNFTSEELVVTVAGTPQAPESGLPETVAFTDTNNVFGVISGSLTFVESTSAMYQSGLDSRQFEYYLVHLSEQPACVFTATNAASNSLEGSCAANTGRDSADERLGVVRYVAGAQTFSVTDVSVGDISTTAKYIHVTAYETGGSGQESMQTLTYTVVDLQKDASTSIPLQAEAMFFDMNGSARVISGKVEFFLDGTDGFYAGTDVFEVYQHTSTSFNDVSELGPLVASFKKPADAAFDGTTLFSMYLGTFDNVLGSEQADPQTSFNLDVGVEHYDYLIIISRTAVNAVTPALGYTPSTSGINIFVEDRVDSYYFLDHLATHTGSCPNAVCPGGDPGTTTWYWPYAEQSDNVDGAVTIYWLTAALDSVVYDVDATQFARLAAYLDNTALDDMTTFFQYSVSLGTSAGDARCDMAATTEWPFGAPAEWSSQPDLTQRSLFYIVADYQNLKACGFTDTSGGLIVSGTITLRLLASAQRTDSAGSSTPNSEAQLSVQAGVQITFSDTTHASIASVAVENLVVVDTISTSVSISSALTLYSDAFLATVNPELRVFVAGTDYFYVEHALTSNNENFDLQLERLWFSSGPLITDAIEYLAHTSSSAFTNTDTPAVTGRYRFQMQVPYLMNCKPCYMHVVSSLSVATSQKGLGDNFGPKTASSTFMVFVETAAADLGDSASMVEYSVLGAGTMLVLGRL